jgi:hypothetical protein
VVIKLIESTIKGSAKCSTRIFPSNSSLPPMDDVHVPEGTGLYLCGSSTYFFHRFRFRFHNLRFHRFRAEPEPEPASCQNKVQMSSVEAQDMKTQNLLWIIKTCCQLYIHNIREHKISKAQKIRELKMLKPRKRLNPKIEYCVQNN